VVAFTDTDIEGERHSRHCTGRVARQTDEVDGVLRPWVLHVDLDQFIAAVEVLRRPELAGVPLIVGGRGDPTERAVVSTASYEARVFGVGSGMPLRLAARKAPSAVILPVDAAAYEAASAQVMAVLRGMNGAVVQVLGWDEAFVGAQTGDPEAFAHRIQAEVLAATRLHCSVGIGDNKIRAKIATGFGKPRGMFRLTAANWFEVMGHRPTIELWGVGTKVSARLAKHGIGTVAELAGADLAVLVGEFGPRMGTWYAALGRGHGSAVVDDTPWVARGHSREHTFQRDLTEFEQVDEAIRQLVGEVLADVAREGRPAVRLTVKVRYAPFFTRTFSRTLPEPTTDPAVILAATRALVAKRKTGRPIRLLGLRVEMTMPED
jgi:DNA polymerase-4